jgi:hypothetical protein
VKIFSPAREDWNTLYVELATWEMAEFTRSFTTFMRRGTTGEDRVELINYIPRDLFNRYKAINAIGNQARLESNKTTTFRVSFGVDYFILQQKLRGSRGPGSPLLLPADLPPFEHHMQRSSMSPGEAPGRPALTPEQTRKRNREVPSPSGNTPPLKKTFEQQLDSANLVSSPTITPTKSGQGLLAAAALRDSGVVMSVTSTPPRPETKVLKNKGGE